MRALVEYLLPGAAAVRGAENATLLVGAVGVAHGCRVDQVRVLGMYAHSGDVVSVFEAQVGPGLTAVGGAVYPVAVADVGAEAGFPSAYVDDVGI